MSWKLHLLCLGSAIPFGLWAALMKKSGVGNPVVTAMMLFMGSMIPFLFGLNLRPNLQPGVVLPTALAIAIGVGIFHGLGHRSYQYIITHDGQDGINLASANVTMFFEMAAVMCLGNFLILGDKLSWQKALAMVTGGLTIWLYTR